MRVSILPLCAVVLLAAPAADAEGLLASHVRFDDRPTSTPYDVVFAAPPAGSEPSPLFGSEPPSLSALAAPPRLTLASELQTPAPVAVAHEYSQAYQVRRRIHKIGSIAMLPLFGAQLLIGESLYDDDGGGGGKKDAHVAVGAAIGALYAVNTVTGVWNLWEGRKDPAGRTRRVVHSILMLAADTGFLATGLSAPEDGDSDARSRHRALAWTSMGLGTAGYLFMLLTK